jgi:hypothetical protein
MTTEIINLTGTIGHWLNLLVARQIAAQAAKLLIKARAFRNDRHGRFGSSSVVG